MTETEAIALFKALADKSRLQILKSLALEDMYVERLAQRLDLTPATISFHLKKLAQAVPGTTVRFAAVSGKEAVRLKKQEESRLKQLAYSFLSTR